MVFYRTVLFYMALITVIRLMGKRQIGQMEPSEFVVTMLTANLAAIPLEDMQVPIRSGLFPMLIVLITERVLSWISLHSIRLRRLLCGKPVILVENGHPIEANLKKTRVNLDELSCHLRAQGILDMETVQYAILETNGTVTAFPYPQYKPATAMDAGVEASSQELPYTVISGGRLLKENLYSVGKDEAWVSGFLSGKEIKQSDVMLLTVTMTGRTSLIRRQSPGKNSN